MSSELPAANNRIFSLAFADHLENVDAVCNLMHGFMTAVLQSQKMPSSKKKTTAHVANEPNSFRIHISIYERS